MQCLVAPSRKEVDIAHSKGIGLDIGVPSVRNLRHISRCRVFLWLALGLSTLPLHLLWNSAIFSTLQNNNYIIVGASTYVLQDYAFDCLQNVADADTPYQDTICDLYYTARGSTEPMFSLQRLELTDCITQYATNIQAKWSNLVVVFDSADLNLFCDVKPIPLQTSQLFAWETNGRFWSRGYECNAGNGAIEPTLNHTDQYFVQKNLSQAWQIVESDDCVFPLCQKHSYLINHCLATKTSELCKLGFSLSILIVVALSNTIKLVAMICTLKIVRAENLITLGDAVASFLQVLDKSTARHCMKHKEFFEWTSSHRQTRNSISQAYKIRDARTGKIRKLIWFRAVSPRRWISTLLL